MAITAFASPDVLAWSNFAPSSTRIRDPHDGTLVDALTEYEFFLPSRPPRRVGGHFALQDSLTLLITPKCKVFTGVRKTLALLSHEQFHYDVGILIARAAARHFARLKSSTTAGLASKLRQASKLHFETRNKLIQKRYDKDTRHGTNAHYQQIWKSRMKACLAQKRCDKIGGFWL